MALHPIQPRPDTVGRFLGMLQMKQQLQQNRQRFAAAKQKAAAAAAAQMQDFQIRQDQLRINQAQQLTNQQNAEQARLVHEAGAPGRAATTARKQVDTAAQRLANQEATLNLDFVPVSDQGVLDAAKLGGAEVRDSLGFAPDAEGRIQIGGPTPSRRVPVVSYLRRRDITAALDLIDNKVKSQTAGKTLTPVQVAAADLAGYAIEVRPRLEKRLGVFNAKAPEEFRARVQSTLQSYAADYKASAEANDIPPSPDVLKLYMRDVFALYPEYERYLNETKGKFDFELEVMKSIAEGVARAAQGREPTNTEPVDE